MIYRVMQNEALQSKGKTLGKTNQAFSYIFMHCFILGDFVNYCFIDDYKYIGA